MYVASYVSKPERTLGDVLRNISSSSRHLGAKSSMAATARKFLSHREVSAQEAVYRLLPLPLSQGSRQVVFIPTGSKETRTRLFKPMNLIQQLDDEDPDVFLVGLLERYAARPDFLEDICLARFASDYKYSSKKRPSDDSRGVVTDDNHGNPLPKSITLKNGLGYMARRNISAIIRYHQWSIKKQEEQYYLSQLMLYSPWRDEENDFGICFKDSYFSVEESILLNKKKFEVNVEALSEVLENLEDHGIPEQNWNMLAPQTQQQQMELQEEGYTEEESPLNVYHSDNDISVALDTGGCPFDYEVLTNRLKNSEWYNLVLALNSEQYRLHQYIVTWCTDMILTHRSSRPPPFHIFLTGGAGVGKSHLVKAILQTGNKLFCRNDQLNDEHMLVCAPTGAAAYNIGGNTLHSTFLLPVHTHRYNDYLPLSTEKKACLKETIGKCKICIIDEISMVGADMLLTIHRRLCDIMDSDEPFGGLSILAVGDMMQLPPAAQSPVFALPSDDLAALYGSLCGNHFKLVELQEVMRQKGDLLFAELLNRVRVGEQTCEDLQVLCSRQTTETGEDFHAALHIYLFNRDVNSHNIGLLQDLPGPHITIAAQDTKRDQQTGILETAFGEKTSGLLKTLTLAVGAKVILTKNMNISDGLVNTAAGIVTGFLPDCGEYPTESYKPKYVLVKFQDPAVGKLLRTASRGLIPPLQKESTPVPTVEVPVCLGRSSKISGKRVQFPLALSWAGTIHKAQGCTKDKIVVACKGTYQAGQFYTAISRAKTLNGLLVLGNLTPNMIKVNRKALHEVKRLKKESTLQYPVPFIWDCDPEMFLKLLCFNINSLIPHKASLDKDNYIPASHVTVLTETWLKPSDTILLPDSHTALPLYSCSTSRSGGILTLVSKDLLIVQHTAVPGLTTQHQIIIISPRHDTSLRIVLLSIYSNPRVSVQRFLTELDIILAGLPQGLLCLTAGDFNIDLLKNDASSSKLMQVMRHYGFCQLMNSPTHRKGGLLDHIYVNFFSSAIVTNAIATYYSDHLLVTAALPFGCFCQWVTGNHIFGNWDIDFTAELFYCMLCICQYCD